MSIPKKIHYVWMGGAQKPAEIRQYMDSWKTYLPEYELIEWNESNFDPQCNPYVQQAYAHKKWAFVSDYVRLYALYHQGGVYMDTDVEVLRPLDKFLEHGAFSGFESATGIPTGIMAAHQGNRWIKRLLEDYDHRSFVDKNGKLDLTTNVVTITDISCAEFGLVPKNRYQVLKEDVHIYPKQVFCPYDYVDYGSPEQRDKTVTPDTCTIHHFSGSWHTPLQKFRTKLLGLLGENVTNQLRAMRDKRRNR